MPNQRKEIIIKEIKYWKAHKLLPGVYCDFLLALYTKGEGTEEVVAKQVRRDLGLAPSIQLITQLLLLLLSIIVINFEQINSGVKITFLLMFLFGAFWMFKKLKKQRDIYFHLAMVILLAFILIVTMYIGNLYITNQWIINMFVALNFIGWFQVGRKYHLKYLLVIGVVALIFTIIYAFF